MTRREEALLKIGRSVWSDGSESESMRPLGISAGFKEGCVTGR